MIGVLLGQHIYKDFNRELSSLGWFIILQKTRPLIGLRNPEEELRLLEEKARQTYGVYMEKVELKKNLEGENKIIEEENKALIEQLDQEQGQVRKEKEMQDLIAAEKESLEKDLLEKQNKLARLEQQRSKAASDKGKEQENLGLKKEVKDLEGIVTKLSQDKSNKDHIIKTLNDEIEERDVTINKV